MSERYNAKTLKWIGNPISSPIINTGPCQWEKYK